MNDTATLRQLDQSHHLSPFGDWHSLNAAGGRRLITAAEGIYLSDGDGNRLLDAMSGLWNVPLGYSCVEVKDAISAQMQRLPYYNSFFQTSNLPAAELSALLAGICPGTINHFFYGCSGSEAIDSMYRLLCRYWQLRGQPNKRIVIARRSAYHGSSVFGARLGGMAPMHAQSPELPELVHHINCPYSYPNGAPYNDSEFGLQRARELEQAITSLGSANIAAFIGEPIQGAAGVYIPPDSYWPEVERICRQHDILLVSDEVICGFGRTGKWFGCEHWGVQPDMLTMSKGISNGYFPLSAVGVSDAIAATLTSAAAGEFAHGYTNSAQPVACAAAIATINYMREHRVLERVEEELAPAFAAGLQALAQDFAIVDEARSLGLIGAFELARYSSTRERFPAKQQAGIRCREHCIASGVVLRACGDTMVSAPPLTMSLSELDEMFERARSALRLCERDLGFSG